MTREHIATGGRFISFEGIDGSGKSTQARVLADRLQHTNRTVILTREPGGSLGAEEIRSLVLEGDPERWSAETEILLFTAARRDHLEKTIRPALAKGDIVITDRFADSTRIYQGITRGDLRKSVDSLHDLMIGVEPDLTILIDIDPVMGLSRAVARAGKELRFEDMGVDVQRRMRTGFLELAAQTPRIAVIDGSGSAEQVADLVWARVTAHLGSV